MVRLWLINLQVYHILPSERNIWFVIFKVLTVDFESLQDWSLLCKLHYGSYSAGFHTYFAVTVDDINQCISTFWAYWKKNKINSYHHYEGLLPKNIFSVMILVGMGGFGNICRPIRQTDKRLISHLFRTQNVNAWAIL